MRSLVLGLALAATATVTAQEARLMDNLVDKNGVQYYLWAQSISPNHRYVGGIAASAIDGMNGLFVYDLETGEYAVEATVVELGSDIRGVSNTGVATGFNPNAVTLSTDGTHIDLETPAGCESAGRDISNDGNTVAGAYWSLDDYSQHACVWKDGKMIRLPEPAAGEVGFDVLGTSANWCSGDASVIAGYIQDNFIAYPAIVWRLQDDGTYVCDPVCKDYYSEHGADPDKPFVRFRSANLSNNGEWLAVNVAEPNTSTRMAILNLNTGELIRDTESYESQGLAVTDDGTVAGAMNAGMTACIWKAGTPGPEALTSLYDIDLFSEIELQGYHLLYDITPDGEVGIGIGYDSMWHYISYVLYFNGDATGIGKAVAGKDSAAEVARYTPDGTRISAPVKGINLVRRADGSVEKVLVK